MEQLFPNGEFDRPQLEAWVNAHKTKVWERLRVNSAADALESHKWATMVAPVSTPEEAEQFVIIWRQFSEAGTKPVNWAAFEQAWNDLVLQRIVNGEHRDAVFAEMTCKTEKILREYFEVR